MLISIVTPSGDRPEAIKLLKSYIERQNIRHNRQLEWIVIDDGDEPYKFEELLSKQGKYNFLYDRAPWRQQHGQSTQCKNLARGLAKASGEYILFMEDDDWYHPDFITEFVDHAIIHQLDVMGDLHVRYYNIRDQRYKEWNCRTLCALGQTLISRKAIPLMKIVCRFEPFSPDGALWDNAHELELRAGGFVGKALHCSIKAMPGRGGASHGHVREPDWEDDPTLVKLFEWIGADSRNYLPFTSATEHASE